MSLTRYPNIELILDISDKPNNLVNMAMTLTEIPGIIKRKAELIHLHYSIRDRKVMIEMEVTHYAAKADNTYGHSLDKIPGYQPFRKTVTASYDAIVDAATGTVIGPDTILNDPTQLEVGGLLYGIDYMYEFEWYKMVAATQSAIIDTMLSGAIMKADATNAFD